jgi:hypothetical protein
VLEFGDPLFDISRVPSHQIGFQLIQPIDRPRFGYEAQRGELRNLSGGGNLAKSVYWGWKHTRCRQTRIDGRRKALFRLDDIEDRAVNVDPLPMIPWQAAGIASARRRPASPWRSNLHAAFSLSSSTSLSGCD